MIFKVKPHPSNLPFKRGGFFYILFEFPLLLNPAGLSVGGMAGRFAMRV